MPDPSPEANDLEERLSEIDQRLREIQADLAPSEGARESSGSSEPPEPSSSAPAPAPSPEPPARGRSGPLEEVLQHAPRFPQVVEDRLTRRIEELARLQADLLQSLREILSGFERRAPREASREMSVSAGPFASLDEVRAFEQELAKLPGVAGVTLRGYEGTDRAVIDVQVGQGLA